MKEFSKFRQFFSSFFSSSPPKKIYRTGRIKNVVKLIKMKWTILITMNVAKGDFKIENRDDDEYTTGE